MAGRWRAADIPAQRNRVAVVTGANSGIGLVAARELARAGATVLIASRNAAKGEQAAAAIRSAAPDANVAFSVLDLADLSSVQAFASRVREQHEVIDLLVNNAGVMAPPRRLTADGFAKRAAAAGSELVSAAAHPGYAATNLQFAGPASWYEKLGGWIGNRVIAQSAEMGALPTLYAATAPDVPSGAFIGPDGFMEQRGHPHLVTAAGKAYDEDAWRRLWEISEELTGVRYEFAAAAAAG